MITYKLIIDTGKPSEESFKTLKALKEKLKKIKEEYDLSPDDYPYMDILVLKIKQDKILKDVFIGYEEEITSEVLR